MTAMPLADDLRQAAVAAVEHAIAPLLWDVAPQRRERVAEAAVAAAAPFLDGTELERVTTADSGADTVPG